jgi:transposase-like protein
MKGVKTTQEIKDLILSKINQGCVASQLAIEYNISANTIYTWISQSANSDKDKQSMILENSRLKREKQELIELIGRLTIDVSRLNKKKAELL